MFISALSALCLSWSAQSAEAETTSPAVNDVEKGKAVFDQWCWECHGVENHSGTGTWLLRERYKGAITEFIEKRRDLSAGYIRYVVRQGQNGMPNFRETEISEERLAQLVEYLTASKDQ